MPPQSSLLPLRLLGTLLLLSLPLSASLIGHWPLDELSGATAVDASGVATNGVNSGGGLTWETGMIAGGARLDGYPTRSEFAYNISEDGATLSWDTGVFDGDSGRGNGGGCIVHHNIVYDLTPTTLRGGQLNSAKYYHSTLIGPKPDGDTTSANPGDDVDGDGCANLEEFIAGTIPTDRDSHLSVTVSPETPAGTAVVISWTPMASCVHAVLHSTNLATPFTPLQSGIPGSQNSYTDSNPPADHAF